MSKKTKHLTIDYQSILKSSMTDRVSFAQTSEGQSYLASLTPEELARLFPSYYRKQLPDLGKSGGVGSAVAGRPNFSSGGGSSTGAAQPTPRSSSSGEDSSTPAAKPSSSSKPAPSSNAQSNSFYDFVQKYPSKRQPTPGEQRVDPRSSPQARSDQNSSESGRFVVDKKGNIDPTQFRNTMMDKVRKSGLIGFVPPDGAKYGIKKGTAEEWGNYFTGLAKMESSFKTGTHGDRGQFGGHGSRGIFQLSPADAQTYRLQKEPFSYEQLHDPNFNADMALKIHEHWLLKKQSTIKGGVGQYWGPIKRGWTPGQGNDKDLPWKQWSMDDATKVLPPKERTAEDFNLRPGLSNKEQKEESKDALPKSADYDSLDPTLKKYLDGLPEDQRKQMLDDPRLIEAWGEWSKTNPNAMPVEKEQAAEGLIEPKKNETIKPTVAQPHEPNENFGKIASAPALEGMKDANLSEAFPQGSQRFYREGGGTKGLNPKLIEVLKEASKDLPPGYHVRMHSGVNARSTGTKNHPGGVAVDVRIVDSQGKVLKDRGFGEGHKIYEQLAQSMDVRGQQMFPGTKWIWGGAWRAADGDRMHYQIDDPEQSVRGASTSSGQYDMKRGVNPDLWAGRNAVEQFMTPKELKEYRDKIQAQYQLEKEGKVVEPKQAVVPPKSLPENEPDTKEENTPSYEKRGKFSVFVPPRPSSPVATPNIREAPPAGSSVPDSATAIIEPKQPSGTAINPLRPGLSATPSAVPQPVAPETLPSSDQVTKGVSTENLPAVDTPNATAEKLSEWVGSNVPKFEDGGATPVADNATLVSDTGEAVARVNTNENISIKNGMMDVTPANRVDPNDLQQKTEERQDMQTEQIDETEEDNTVPVNHGSMATSIAQGNPNWENMVTDMSQSSAPENFHQTGSARRAYELATSFNSSPVKHYGGFSTTTRFT